MKMATVMMSNAIHKTSPPILHCITTIPIFESITPTLSYLTSSVEVTVIDGYYKQPLL